MQKSILIWLAWVGAISCAGATDRFQNQALSLPITLAHNQLGERSLAGLRIVIEEYRDAFPRSDSRHTSNIANRFRVGLLKMVEVGLLKGALRLAPRGTAGLLERGDVFYRRAEQDQPEQLAYFLRGARDEWSIEQGHVYEFFVITAKGVFSMRVTTLLADQWIEKIGQKLEQVLGTSEDRGVVQTDQTIASVPELRNLKSRLQKRYPTIFGSSAQAEPRWIEEFCRSLLSGELLRRWLPGKDQEKATRFQIILRERFLSSSSNKHLMDDLARSMDISLATVRGYEKEMLELIAKAGESFDLHQRMKAHPANPQTYEEFLTASIDAIPLSRRTYNGLRAGIHGVEKPPPTLREVFRLTEPEFLRIKNLGRGSLNEIKDLMRIDYGLHFAHRLNPFQITEAELRRASEATQKFHQQVVQQSGTQRGDGGNGYFAYSDGNLLLFYRVFGRGTVECDAEFTLEPFFDKRFTWDGRTITMGSSADRARIPTDAIELHVNSAGHLDLYVPGQTRQQLLDYFQSSVQWQSYLVNRKTPAWTIHPLSLPSEIPTPRFLVSAG